MQHMVVVPQPGMEPSPPAVEAWNLNPWTTRRVPVIWTVTEIKILPTPEGSDCPPNRGKGGP